MSTPKPERPPGYTISLRIDGPRWAQPAVEQMADALTDISNALTSIALTYRQEHEYATAKRAEGDGTAPRGGDELLRATEGAGPDHGAGDDQGTDGRVRDVLSGGEAPAVDPGSSCESAGSAPGRGGRHPVLESAGTASSADVRSQPDPAPGGDLLPSAETPGAGSSSLKYVVYSPGSKVFLLHPAHRGWTAHGRDAWTFDTTDEAASHVRDGTDQTVVLIGSDHVDS